MIPIGGNEDTSSTDAEKKRRFLVILLEQLTFERIHQKCADFGCTFSASVNSTTPDLKHVTASSVIGVSGKVQGEAFHARIDSNLARTSNFMCHVCRFTCDSSGLLRAHFISSHVKEESKKKDDCGSKISNGLDLKNEESVDEDDNPRNLKVFRPDLNSHIDNHDPKQGATVLGKLPCTICGRSLNKSRVKDHEEDHHSGVLRFKCRETACGWSYEFFNNLVKHYELNHDIMISKYESHSYWIVKEEDDVERDEEIWSCSLCTRPFTKEGVRDKHIQNHNSAKNEKCLELGCGWSFNNFTQVKKHYVGNHKLAVVKSNYGDVIVLGSAEIEGVNNRNCPVCNRLFKGEFDENHLRHHDQLRFKCLEEGCGWMYESYNSMKDHYFVCHSANLPVDGADAYLKDRKINTKEKVDSCATCPVCAREISMLKYDEHVESHDVMSHMYRCPDSSCLWMFENYDCLRGHSFSKHGFTLNLRDTLSYLVATNSAKVGQLQCKVCQRQMPDSQYAQHLLNHSDMKYVCKSTNCGWMYEEFDSLRKHYQEKHHITVNSTDVKKFTIEKKETECFCPYCGRRFCKRKTLDEHIALHDFAMYKCPVEDCGWMFQYLGLFKKHQERVHDIQSRASPFGEKCRICTRAVRKNYMFYHLSNHNLMRFKCPKEECGWRFEIFEELKEHCKDKHKLCIGLLQKHVVLMKPGDCNDAMDPTEIRRRAGEFKHLVEKNLNCKKMSTNDDEDDVKIITPIDGIENDVQVVSDTEGTDSDIEIIKETVTKRKGLVLEKKVKRRRISLI